MDTNGEITLAASDVTASGTRVDEKTVNEALREKTTTTAENEDTKNRMDANNFSSGAAAKGTSYSTNCPFKFTPAGSFGVNTPEEVAAYYDNWAGTYDEWTKYCGYNGPQYLTDLVKRYCRTTDLILIVGVGTGLEAQLLFDSGYRQMHGVDGSIEMLNRAKTKGHLLELIHEFLQPNARSSIESHRYDTMLCVGCFVPGGLDERHVDDLLRTLKPGGISIIGTRETFINDPGEAFNYPYSLESKLKQLEQAGAITLLDRVRKEHYGDNSVGVFFIHRVNHS
uniref:Methyltransferase domain-containing protein n=1 Tax=Plectus sambesii TaxID=2011161 RepID=A0A914WTV9_9BILA